MSRIWAGLWDGYDWACELMAFYVDFAVSWWKSITPVEYAVVITLIAAVGYLLMGAKDRSRI